MAANDGETGDVGDDGEDGSVSRRARPAAVKGSRSSVSGNCRGRSGVREEWESGRAGDIQGKWHQLTAQREFSFSFAIASKSNSNRFS